MGLYNFKQQFVPMILDGSKRHTIRGPRRYSDEPGDLMHLYTGLRTKKAKLLLRVPCVRVEGIQIDGSGITLDGIRLSKPEADLLAWHDGFRLDETVFAVRDEDLAAHVGCFHMLMLPFWRDAGKLPFTGRVYHWRAGLERD